MALPDKLKNPIPLKAIPEETLNTLLEDVLTEWLTDLLSLKDEDSARKLYQALPVIKKHCWSLGLNEVCEMFEMYADSKTALIPRSNYFDRVLVGQIFEAYKQIKQTRVKPKKDKDQKIAEEKMLQDKIDIENHYDAFLSYGKVDSNSTWIAVYLEEKGIWDITDKQKRFAWDRAKDQTNDKDERKEIYSKYLLRQYFEKLQAKGDHVKNYL